MRSILALCTTARSNICHHQNLYDGRLDLAISDGHLFWTFAQKVIWAKKQPKIFCILIMCFLYNTYLLKLIPYIQSLPFAEIRFKCRPLQNISKVEQYHTLLGYIFDIWKRGQYSSNTTYMICWQNALVVSHTKLVLRNSEKTERTSFSFVAIQCITTKLKIKYQTSPLTM